MGSIIFIDSIVVMAFCLFGMTLPKIFKDEDERYGINALIVAFMVGFFVNLIVFLLVG